MSTSTPETSAPAPVPDIHVYPSGRFEFAPQIKADRRSKLVRELSLVKGPTPAPWPSNRLPRPYKAPASPALDELRRVVSRGVNAREQTYAGRPVGPYQVEITNGHVAILAPGPGTGPETRLFVPVDAPRQFVIDDDFWAAYSRVRTCRHERSKSVRVKLSESGLVLEAGSLDVLGWDSRESVRPVYEADRVPRAGFQIILDDRYVWPLRGLTGTVRQDDKGIGPTWWQLDQVPPVLIMPMRD
jgi:hypothetical protein